MAKTKFRLSPPRFIALGFLLVILVGAGLLCLPFASKGESVGFLDALFTATSATCVTGLVVRDTFTTWTGFGGQGGPGGMGGGPGGGGSQGGGGNRGGNSGGGRR